MNTAQIAQQIRELLYLRHSSPEWVGFDELRNTTGFPHTGSPGMSWEYVTIRYLDFFALNLFPSKKHIRVAYEIKASRSDFLSELANPDKRTFAWSIANRCFFVCPAGMIGKDEVPKGWGLVELAEVGLRNTKRAQWHPAMDMPIGFVAAIARRSTVREK